MVVAIGGKMHVLVVEKRFAGGAACAGSCDCGGDCPCWEDANRRDFLIDRRRCSGKNLVESCQRQISV